jgi:hypothetical protein
VWYSRPTIVAVALLYHTYYSSSSPTMPYYTTANRLADWAFLCGFLCARMCVCLCVCLFVFCLFVCLLEAILDRLLYIHIHTCIYTQIFMHMCIAGGHHT